MNSRLSRAVLLVAGAYFLFLGFSKAAVFLLPIIFAILFAMLMAPIARKIEAAGLKRGWASLICVFIIIGFFIALFFLVSTQVTQAAADLSGVKQHIQSVSNKWTSFLHEKLGVDIKNPIQKIFSQSGGLLSYARRYFSSFIGFFGSALLVMVYTFFFLSGRDKFSEFLLKISNKKEDMKEVINKSAVVAQRYLLGRFILMCMLTILYAIGLTIVGIPNVLIISLIAAIFSIIPYIGNLIAAGLAMAMGVVAGGGIGTIVGVALVFVITQIIDSYIFEPFILGHEVNLDPLWTIIFVMLGAAVWGIAGMVIAIPLMGIIKVGMDNIDGLQPYSALIGDDKNKQGKTITFVKKKVQKIFKKKIK